MSIATDASRQKRKMDDTQQRSGRRERERERDRGGGREGGGEGRDAKRLSTNVLNGKGAKRHCPSRGRPAIEGCAASLDPIPAAGTASDIGQLPQKSTQYTHNQHFQTKKKKRKNTPPPLFSSLWEVQKKTKKLLFACLSSRAVARQQVKENEARDTQTKRKKTWGNTFYSHGPHNAYVVRRDYRLSCKRKYMYIRWGGAIHHCVRENTCT